MASALRRHVTADLASVTVSWLLPCSKTDPKAVGLTRCWGCVSDGRRELCPYHALSEHLALLDASFPQRDWPDLPLFPDLAGATAPKEKFVESLEA
eukprot:189050-Alexandrium_andersonii.AAC.1